MQSDVRLERAPLWLRLAAGFVLVLNVLDGAFTLLWTTAGFAEEANPLMAQVIHSPVHFMLVKLSLVSLGLLLLWRLRWRNMAQLAIGSSAMGYAVLLAYHLSAVPDFVARFP
jgi:hypothetical protein